MKSMLASMAVVLMFCAAPAVSAEFPKTGSAEYDTYYVSNVVAKMDSGAGTGILLDTTGINRLWCMTVFACARDRSCQGAFRRRSSSY